MKEFGRIVRSCNTAQAIITHLTSIHLYRCDKLQSIVATNIKSVPCEINLIYVYRLLESFHAHSTYILVTLL